MRSRSLPLRVVERSRIAEDIVGLYLPPEHALVLCVDEKSQIQSSGPHPIWPAVETRTRRDHDARLQTEWHGYCSPR